MDLVFAPSQIETWPLDRLRPYARNAKIHGTDQVAKIAASMAKFGWTVPCMVADDGELIAGHGRVLAAAMLGLKDVPVTLLEVPVRALGVGDGFVIRAGCDKQLATCRDRFANALNFRGFPSIPGQDAVLRYASSGDANQGVVL